MRYPLLAAVVTAAIALAQDPQTPPPGGTAPANGNTTPPAIPGVRANDPDPRPYDKVITKDAKTQEGVFKVHQIRTRYYYEIPAKELGKEFLWVSQISRNTLGGGYGGQALNNRVVKWERHGNRVFLRSVLYEITANPRAAISRAVQSSNENTILMAFPIEAFGKDEAPVIDVGRLFSTDVPEFSARQSLRARAMDSSRSFLERVSAFPTNIEVEATHTYTASTDSPTGPGGPTPPVPQSPFATSMRGTTATVGMHFSMVKLPENPMMPRLADARVGYFSIATTDYGREEHKAASRRYITRWRLEKKDPSAAVSEPVKPIVYYVDPATPEKWAPFVKKGIEDWQPAFEAAGFKNAILAKDPPKDDPAWSPEDARNSVVRWLPSTIENAMGPHVHDPRTGEILESDIRMFHNVMRLAETWYFTQASPNDPRAQKLPLPDDLMGELIRYVVAHEVGHTLGFPHNMKASSLYPLAKVRDREWVKKMGHTPTLMDYSRFNYVAQPEDKIDAADLIPKIGPYDTWATIWGYKPVPGATSPDEEKKTLDEWAREQDKTSYYRFSTEDSLGSDPGENTEAVGDADAVAATALGVKNLSRVMDYLLTATEKNGEDWEDLELLYSRTLGQWSTEMNHVAQLVGGFDSQQKHGGQSGVRFTPVPRERQAGAVKFLNDNAFTTPAMFVKPEILRRIEPAGVASRIRQAQSRILTSLLASPRMQRLFEQEAIDGTKAYSATDFLGDLRKGVWKEALTPNAKADLFRRNLQRAYLDAVAERLNGPTRATDDQRALLRAELKKLSRELATTAGDAASQAHLEDSRDLIAKILDPKIQWTAPTAAATGFGGRRGLDADGLTQQDTCWPDSAIHREPQQ